jgi:thioester reductase-like protein
LNLIKLSSESRKYPEIFFISSIGTLGNWATHHPGEAVPEIALENPSVSTAQGYSESKWITERLLDAARETSGVSSAVLRVGQIAGPSHVAKGKFGMWNKQEWLPSVTTPLRLSMTSDLFTPNPHSDHKELEVSKTSPQLARRPRCRELDPSRHPRSDHR